MSKLLWPVLCFLILLGGCAPGYSTRESRSVYPKYWGEYTGPGEVPPSWYNYDPNIGSTFSPWYVNPYQQ